MARAAANDQAPEPPPTRCDHGALRAALDSLPSDERQMLELVYVEELTGPAIAARTGRPLGTVKTVIRRARARLADVLAQPKVDATRIRRRSA
jgi:RNA polymerase sigma-70 factor (ECF subfamily)